MNDLTQIKKYIFDNSLVGILLERLGCKNVRSVSNYYLAELPEQFNSDRKGNVQVYVDDEYLKSFVWTRGVEGDIYTLTSYLMLEDNDELRLQKHLPKAKRKIQELLGLDSFWVEEDEKDDPNAWLKKIQQRKKKRLLLSEYRNEILPENTMNEFLMLPAKKWLEDGIPYETQKEFEVGIDITTSRIIFPIRNVHGQLVAVKGRRLNPHDEAKYLYIYPFAKSYDLFNLHRALPYIKQRKEIIIFEAEKSCMQAYSFNVKNTVALMGDDISKVQVELIKRHCGTDISIVIALDKDKTVKDVRKVASRFDDFERIYSIFDTKNYLIDKESPTDQGVGVWNKLYRECRYSIEL